MNTRNKAVFLDKDGTLIRNIPYNVDPSKIELAPDAIEALRQLQEAGYLFVVITNQSGVARGLFTESDLIPVKDSLKRTFEKEGITLHGFYYCPHHPQGIIAGYSIHCTCRKPEPGMIIAAARELNIDTSLSWMIGDSPEDVRAGRQAGCRTILITQESTFSDEIKPDHACRSLLEAAGQILG